MTMEIRVDIGADERRLSIAKCWVKSAGDSIILKTANLYNQSILFLYGSSFSLQKERFLRKCYPEKAQVSQAGRLVRWKGQPLKRRYHPKQTNTL